MAILDKTLWLIDAASEQVGSDSQLANYLQVSRGNVCDWRADRKPCPLADIALMADLSGLDAGSWVIDVLIDQHSKTVKGMKLANVFKKH